MPRPNLIHPVQVTIERLVRSEMLMDDDAREAVHSPRTTAAQTYQLPAQIKWDDKDNPSPEDGGIRERSGGYILCRLYDMDLYLGTGVRLKRGDRITAMGILTDLDLYLTKEGPAGHYPDQQGQSMIRYYFEDRAPVQQRGDL